VGLSLIFTVVKLDLSSLDGIASKPLTDWVGGLVLSEVLDLLPKLKDSGGHRSMRFMPHLLEVLLAKRRRI